MMGRTMERSGPQDTPAPKLFIHGLDGGGLLKLVGDDGSPIAAPLDARHVRVLLALNDALEADGDLDPILRGWRNDECIAWAYAQGDPHVIPPAPEAIAAYRAQLNKRVRKETPASCRPPKLFLTQRCVGVRLVQRLEVVDLSRRKGPPP